MKAPLGGAGTFGGEKLEEGKGEGKEGQIFLADGDAMGSGNEKEISFLLLIWERGSPTFVGRECSPYGT